MSHILCVGQLHKMGSLGMSTQSLGFGKYTIIGVTMILLGTICFASGYYLGRVDQSHHTRRAVDDQGQLDVPSAASSAAPPHLEAPSSNIPSVKPHQVLPSPELPPHHPPISSADTHGHPVFDCARVLSAVELPPAHQRIKDLAQRHDTFEGRSVKVSGVIVGAYLNILNTNWYHICDAPRGQVLVVSSRSRARAGQLVELEGELSLNYQVGGVYTFPLFIKDATLRGEGVEVAIPDSDGLITL